MYFVPWANFNFKVTRFFSRKLSAVSDIIKIFPQCHAPSKAKTDIPTSTKSKFKVSSLNGNGIGRDGVKDRRGDGRTNV